MKKYKKEFKPYRVVFNGNWNNYEDFCDLEEAENFACKYYGGKVFVMLQRQTKKK